MSIMASQNSLFNNTTWKMIETNNDAINIDVNNGITELTV